MGSAVGFLPPGEINFDFWGIVVKPGEAVKCDPGKLYCHISHIVLEAGKVNENVKVFVEVDGKRFLLGTLSVDKHPHISTDLVFKKEFKLLHSSNTSNISFIGYKIIFTSDSPAKQNDESDEVPLAIPLDSNADDDKSKEAKHGANKLTAPKQSVAAPSSKPNATVEKAKNPRKPKADDDDSDEDDDDSEEGESDDDEDMTDAQNPSDENDGESSDGDEVSPPQNAKGKNKTMETPLKTPPAKKAKLTTPYMGNKTGYVHVATPYPAKQAKKTSAYNDGSAGKKSGHVHFATPHPAKQAKKTPAYNDSSTRKKSGQVHFATPHPAKQAKKTPANNDKSKQSTGYICKPCDRTFNSPMGLEDHSEVKHGATK